MRFLILSLKRSGSLANRNTLIGSVIVAPSPNIIYVNNFLGDIGELFGVRLSLMLVFK
jgi:hypothetical protein